MDAILLQVLLAVAQRSMLWWWQSDPTAYRLVLKLMCCSKELQQVLLRTPPTLHLVSTMYPPAAWLSKYGGALASLTLYQQPRAASNAVWAFLGSSQCPQLTCLTGISCPRQQQQQQQIGETGQQAILNSLAAALADAQRDTSWEVSQQAVDALAEPAFRQLSSTLQELRLNDYHPTLATVLPALTALQRLEVGCDRTALSGKHAAVEDQQGSTDRSVYVPLMHAASHDSMPKLSQLHVYPISGGGMSYASLNSTASRLKHLTSLAVPIAPQHTIASLELGQHLTALRQLKLIGCYLSVSVYSSCLMVMRLPCRPSACHPLQQYWAVTLQRPEGISDLLCMRAPDEPKHIPTPVLGRMQARDVLPSSLECLEVHGLLAGMIGEWLSGAAAAQQQQHNGTAVVAAVLLPTLGRLCFTSLEDEDMAEVAGVLAGMASCDGGSSSSSIALNNWSSRPAWESCCRSIVSLKLLNGTVPDDVHGRDLLQLSAALTALELSVSVMMPSLAESLPQLSRLQRLSLEMKRAWGYDGDHDPVASASAILRAITIGLPALQNLAVEGVESAAVPVGHCGWVEQEAAEAAARLSECWLDVVGRHKADDSPPGLRCLTALSLTSCGITDAVLQHCLLYKLPSLTRLVLSHELGVSAQAGTLEALMCHPRLRLLCLSNTGFVPWWSALPIGRALSDKVLISREQPPQGCWPAAD